MPTLIKKLFCVWSVVYRMMSEITLYRCYWPTVYGYLKRFEITNFKSEAFGMLMTLDIAPELARRISTMLPIGAVVDLVEVSSDPIELVPYAVDW